MPPRGKKTARQKAAERTKVTAEDIDKGVKEAEEGLAAALPFLDMEKASKPYPQYEAPDRSRVGMNEWVRKMSPQELQRFSWRGEKQIPEVTYTGKEIEDMRMRQLLNKRKDDPEAMREYKELRKDLEMPKNIEASQTTWFDWLNSIGQQEPYAFVRPSMTDDKDVVLRRSDEPYPGSEANLMAHELGHAIEGDILLEPEKVDKEKPKQIRYINQTFQKYRPFLGDQYTQIMLGQFADRSERRQRLYGPIKMAISRWFGTIPVSKAEFDVMKRKLNDPDVKKHIIENALVVTDHEANVRNFRIKEGEDKADAALKMYEEILEKAYDEILKSKPGSEEYDDFMTYAKAETQSPRQLAAAKLQSDKA